MSFKVPDSLRQGRYLVLDSLQSFHDVLLNRDNNNEPKTLMWGGTQRVRVSPQSWNRAIRLAVREELANEQRKFGVTTRQIPQMVYRELVDTFGHEDNFETHVIANAAIASSGLKVEASGKGVTQVTIPIPHDAGRAIAKIAHENWDAIAAFAAPLRESFAKSATKAPKKDEVVAADRSSGESEKGIRLDSADPSIGASIRRELDPQGEIDIALFGRFVAEFLDEKLTSAVSTASAFTIAGAAISTDNFTIADDIALAAGISGSPFPDDMRFTTGTFYRHAYLDREVLRQNIRKASASMTEAQIEEEVRHAEDLFVTAFMTAVPSAKSTRSGSDTLPFFTMMTDTDAPINAAKAFESHFDMSPSMEMEAAQSLVDYVESTRWLKPAHNVGFVWMPGDVKNPEPQFKGSAFQINA